MRASPGEAVIEDHDLVGSTLPLTDEPGAGLQLRAEACPGSPGLLHLHRDLAESTLRLRAEPPESEFLRPAGDRSDQQVAAEMGGRIGFVETALLFAELV